MFGRGKVQKSQETDIKIAGVEQEIAELKDKLKNSETELEAVNRSTHL